MARNYPALVCESLLLMIACELAFSAGQCFPYLSTIAAVMIVTNLTSFLLYGCDKLISGKHLTRVPESVLLGAGFLGGTPSANASMWVFHHKVSKADFRKKFIIVTVIQIAAVTFGIYQGIIIV